MPLFGRDLGIDLGTINTLICEGSDIVLHEPTVVAIDVDELKIVEVGQAAREMDGRVPDTMDELLTLPGVARKSANAILQHGFGKVVGIVVDTHVIRVAGRLGWTRNTDPEKIERDLMELFEKRTWRALPFYLKSHGRAVCRAPVPRCGACAVAALCPSALSA